MAKPRIRVIELEDPIEIGEDIVEKVKVSCVIKFKHVERLAEIEAMKKSTKQVAAMKDFICDLTELKPEQVSEMSMDDVERVFEGLGDRARGGGKKKKRKAPKKDDEKSGE